MSRLLELADGPGGIAALIAGDVQSEDGKLAPAVFQLAGDPDRPDEILATITLAYLGPQHQITVWPQTLTVAEYEALAGIFATAADTSDVGPDDAPYGDFGAPPWIRLAAAPVAPGGQQDEFARPGCAESPRKWPSPQGSMEMNHPGQAAPVGYAEPDGAVGYLPPNLPRPGDLPPGQFQGDGRDRVHSSRVLGGQAGPTDRAGPTGSDQEPRSVAGGRRSIRTGRADGGSATGRRFRAPTTPRATGRQATSARSASRQDLVRVSPAVAGLRTSERLRRPATAGRASTGPGTGQTATPSRRASGRGTPRQACRSRCSGRSRSWVPPSNCCRSRPS